MVVVASSCLVDVAAAVDANINFVTAECRRPLFGQDSLKQMALELALGALYSE